MTPYKVKKIVSTVTFSRNVRRSKFENKCALTGQGDTQKP